MVSADHQNSKPKVPKGIGPHDGRERTLLLKGLKHVAYFTDHEPAWLAAFARRHAATSGWITWRHVWRDRPFYNHVLFRHSHTDWAVELVGLV